MTPTFTVTPPSHGTLSAVNGATVTYTPASGYVGTDSFTFKANDGGADSNPATVSITVGPAPAGGTLSVGQATAQSGGVASVTLNVDGKTSLAGLKVIVAYDSSKLTLADKDLALGALWTGNSFSRNASQPGQAVLVFGSATDVAGPGVLATLNFQVLASGVAGGTYPVTVTAPSANNAALQNVTLTVVNGAVTVVGPANRPPEASSQLVSTPESTPVAVMLTAADADGDKLTASVVTQPAHGSLTPIGVGSNTTYTPTAGYAGPDSFTFKANDGAMDSNVATVSITVNPFPPIVIPPQPDCLLHDSSKAIVLSAKTTDGHTPDYMILTQPAHGRLTQIGTGPNASYIPNKGYVGADSFTFQANDGPIASNSAIVTSLVSGKGS